ncbi:MAG: hypothetical protein JRG88_13930 [Deltaproteobacteria bacterium]|nr:hypothetical protein [Deltaproteobacteria bacterium]
MSNSLEDVHLKALLAAFFEDATLMEAFKRAPAAKMMHHAYLGGLLEHTLSMALLSDTVAGHYGGIDRDLLLGLSSRDRLFGCGPAAGAYSHGDPHDRRKNGGDKGFPGGKGDAPEAFGPQPPRESGIRLPGGPQDHGGGFAALYR